MIALYRPTMVEFTVTGIDSKGAPVQTARCALLKARNYTATINGLQIYDDYGEFVRYTVTEGAIPGYIMDVGLSRQPDWDSEDNMEAWITNRLDPVNVYVEKGWDGIHPDAAPWITIALHGDRGRIIRSWTMGWTKGWEHTFTNLPRYSASGQEIRYWVSEVSVATGFIPSVEYITPPSKDKDTVEWRMMNKWDPTATRPPWSPPPGFGEGEELYFLGITDLDIPLAGAGTLKHLGDCFD